MCFAHSFCGRDGVPLLQTAFRLRWWNTLIYNVPLWSSVKRSRCFLLEEKNYQTNGTGPLAGWLHCELLAAVFCEAGLTLCTFTAFSFQRDQFSELDVRCKINHVDCWALRAGVTTSEGPYHLHCKTKLLLLSGKGRGTVINEEIHSLSCECPARLMMLNATCCRVHRTQIHL